MAKRFRGLRYFLAPPWLTGKGDGDKIAYTLEAMIDVFVERLRQGLEARFPRRAGESAIKLITGDRGLLRGRSETLADLADRLLAWRTPRTHRVRGNAYEALEQIWSYWGGIYCATIDSHGTRHFKNVDGTDGKDTVDWTSAGDILWDGADADDEWSRFWVVLASNDFGPSPGFGDPALWGGAIGTPGYLLGVTGATIDDVTAMRSLFQELHWGPGHALPEWVIIGTDSLAQLLPVPDGNWQYWSKDNGSGTRVPARVPSSPSFTHGPREFRNGAGAMAVTMPATVPDGSLLFWFEGRAAAGAFDAPPTGWTLVAEQTAATTRARVLVRDALGATADGGTDVAYSPTGADDHAVRVTAVSPPDEGWSATALSNVAEIATSFGTDTVTMPDNTSGRHRLAFVMLNDGDTGIEVAPFDPTLAYEEIYDADPTDEMNLSLHGTTVDVTDAELVPSAGSPEWALVSFRLVYNLSWRLWSIDPERNNTYPGSRTRPWPNAAELVNGDAYAGDRSNTAAFDDQILPNGRIYAGSRTRFPDRVLLLDEGSLPR
jgi:hypothetical protein